MSQELLDQMRDRISDIDMSKVFRRVQGLCGECGRNLSTWRWIEGCDKCQIYGPARHQSTTVEAEINSLADELEKHGLVPPEFAS